MKKLLSIKLTDAECPALIIGFGDDKKPEVVSVAVYIGQPVSDVAKTLKFLVNELTA